MLAVVTLAIILMWIVCASVLVGMGAFLLHGLDVECSLFGAFWTGLFATVTCLQVYHLFRAIDGIIAALVCAVGLCGIFLNRDILTRDLRKIARIGFLPAAGCIAIVLVIGVRCSGPAVHYDTGFYGATAVRWLVTYPIVPGLANLVGPIGFNSDVFLCVAVLNQGPWPEAGFHLFVGLLLCAFVMMIAATFSRVLVTRKETALNYFVLLFSIPCMVWVLTWEIVGTNTDLPPTIVSIAGMIALFQLFQGKNKDQAEEGRIESLLLVSLMLFALAVTFKLSSLAISGLGWCTAFVQLFSLNCSVRRKRQLLRSAIMLTGVLAIPWLCRGVILSGYPLFPSSVLAIPVDWRVPRANVDLLAQLTRSWARIPHATINETSGMRWFGKWLAGVITNRADFIVPGFLSLVGFVALLSRRRLKNLFWLKLLVPSLGGLVFWLSLGPAPRFGESAIWTTAACLGAVALQQVVPAMSHMWRCVVLFGVLLVGGWCSYPRTLWRVNFRPLLDVHGFLSLPGARTMPDLLASGLTVQVPVDTNQCWDAALPCSPYFTDNLRLRRTKVLRWGFRADGPDQSSLFDKFTPLHRQYVRSSPVQEVCSNCHAPSK